MPLSDPERQLTAQDLVETCKALEQDLGSHKDYLRQVSLRADRIRRGMVVALIVAGLGVVVGIGGLLAARDVAAQNDRIEAARAEARNGACIQDNVSTVKTRLALKSSLLTFVPEGQTLNEQQQAAFDRYGAQVDAALPFRDCSVLGIAAYYENPPEDPAIGGTS